MQSLVEFLTPFANTVEVVRGQSQWRLEQRWNESFAKGAKETTGNWVIDGMRWQSFSSGFDVALAGARAQLAYASRLAIRYFAFSSEIEFHLVMCSDAELPPVEAILDYVYGDRTIDLYLTDADFNWTFVVPHEQRYGPYFAEREPRRGV